CRTDSSSTSIEPTRAGRDLHRRAARRGHVRPQRRPPNSCRPTSRGWTKPVGCSLHGHRTCLRAPSAPRHGSKVARRGRGVLPPDGARTRPDRTVATCRPGLRIEQPFGRSGPSCRQRLSTGLADSVLMPVTVGLMTFRIRATRLIECRLKSPLLPGKIDERYCILKDVFRIPGLSSLDFLAAGKKSHGRDTVQVYRGLSQLPDQLEGQVCLERPPRLLQALQSQVPSPRAGFSADSESRRIRGRRLDRELDQFRGGSYVRGLSELFGLPEGAVHSCRSVCPVRPVRKKVPGPKRGASARTSEPDEY